MAKNIPFPIETKTACLLKWNFSTITLENGTTQSCHRNQPIPFSAENFNNFHNLPEKITQRETMLKGEWPTPPFELYDSHQNCTYCKKIEKRGGRSDRQYMNETMQDQTPDELEHNPTATHVTPAVLELYIDNRCNLACNYCSSNYSSRIESELKKHHNRPVNLEAYLSPSLSMNDGFYRQLSREEKQKYLDAFLNYITEHGKSLRRLNLAGGEPFYQPEFTTILEHIRKDAYPNLVLAVITNAMVAPRVFRRQVDALSTLLDEKRIDRVDLTASVDCWGAAQEYIRWGFKCDTFEQNVMYAAKQKNIDLQLNGVHSILSLHDYMPLVHKKREWENAVGKKIQMFANLVGGSPHMESEMLGGEYWHDTFQDIRNNWPVRHSGDVAALENIKGLINFVEKQYPPNRKNMKHFLTYFNEIDQRRNTDWKQTFPQIRDEIQKHYPNLTCD